MPATCELCQETMVQGGGCSSEKKIEFVDGVVLEAIPWGEGQRFQTFTEYVADLEGEIEDGGRGDISVETISERLEQFRAETDPEAFDERACHDCGAAIGEMHHPRCDMEECPRCGGQLLSCPCEVSADFAGNGT